MIFKVRRFCVHIKAALQQEWPWREGNNYFLYFTHYVILERRKGRRLKKLKRKVWVKEIFKDRELEGAFTLTIKNLRRFNDRENHFR